MALDRALNNGNKYLQAKYLKYSYLRTSLSKPRIIFMKLKITNMHKTV